MVLSLFQSVCFFFVPDVNPSQTDEACSFSPEGPSCFLGGQKWSLRGLGFATFCWAGQRVLDFFGVFW